MRSFLRRYPLIQTAASVLIAALALTPMGQAQQEQASTKAPAGYPSALVQIPGGDDRPRNRCRRRRKARREPRQAARQTRSGARSQADGPQPRQARDRGRRLLHRTHRSHQQAVRGLHQGRLAAGPLPLPLVEEGRPRPEAQGVLREGREQGPELPPRGAVALPLQQVRMGDPRGHGEQARHVGHLRRCPALLHLGRPAPPDRGRVAARLRRQAEAPLPPRRRVVRRLDEEAPARDACATACSRTLARSRPTARPSVSTT